MAPDPTATSNINPTAPVLLFSDQQISPVLALEILPKGLTFSKFLLNPGATHDILIGQYDIPKDLEDPKAPRRFQNCIVGRNANRLAVGPHDIEKNGIAATINPVTFESPTVSLHGGPRGLDQHTFTQLSSPGILFSPAEVSSVSTSLGADSVALFATTSPHGDQGFPGELRVEVLIGLLPGGKVGDAERDGVTHLGSLLVVYRAKLSEVDGKKVVCPVNLTQHWGFNLEVSIHEAGAGKDVKSHKLSIKSDNIVDLDSVGLSTGKLTPTTGTAHEHSGKLIGENFPEGGYDSYYLFSEPPPATQPSHIPLNEFEKIDLITPIINQAPFDQKQVKVELESEKSGLKIAFSSNQPGVQFYSGNFLDGSGTKKAIHGGGPDTGGYEAGSAAFLEFHDTLEAYKYPYGLTQEVKRDTLLTSDEVYNNWVRADISLKEGRK